MGAIALTLRVVLTTHGPLLEYPTFNTLLIGVLFVCAINICQILCRFLYNRFCVVSVFGKTSWRLELPKRLSICVGYYEKPTPFVVVKF